MRNTPEASRLLLASNNAHKRAELERVLVGFELVVPADLGIEFDYEERGSSFLDNALGKALCLLGLVGSRPDIRGVVADDSGLCVDALGGRPGVQSNRYGSEGGALLDPEAKIRLVLQELGDGTERSASFVCALVFAMQQDRFFAFQEVLRGSIARTPRGVGGFGYDPVFLVPELGRTVADLSPAEKDAVSHRGRAARRLMALLASLDQEGRPRHGVAAGG